MKGNKDKIHNWIHNIIEESGGFKSCEKHEIMVHNISREHSIAAWVIRCLANPDCEGSKETLESIHVQRNKKSE